MPRHPRLTAALCTTALAASLATPTLDSAFASSPVPALPDITAALSGAGISNVSSITSELSTLQGVSPGGSLGLLSLGSLDNALTTLNGGLLGSLLTPVLSLLTALNPAAPSSLNQTLADLQQIGAAPGASAAVVSAVNELSAALRTAGLGQLLSQVSGLSGAQDTSALSALAGLQGTGLGGNVAAGSLAPVSTVLSALATDAGAGAAATSLTSAAATLNGSGALTPGQLLSVIGQVQSAAGGLPAPLNGVAGALAAQLSGATSLFGELASVGSGPSSQTVTGALAGLGALPGLAPGASVPNASLVPLASVLNLLAGDPGVPAGAVTTLSNVASTLGGAVSPSSLLSVIASLQGVSGLPAPLGSLVSEVTGALAGSGSIFGGVPGLSSGQVTSALTVLQGLPGLAGGSSVPSGLLAPVGGILGQISAQSGVPLGSAGTLTSLAGILGGTSALNPAQLLAVVATLQSVGATLPAPLSTVVGELAGLLAGSGSLTPAATTTGGGTGATGTGGTGGTGAGGTGVAGTGSGASGSGSGASGSGGLSGAGVGGIGAATGSSGHAGIARVWRAGRVIVVTLRCTASANRTCHTTVTAAQNGKQRGHTTVTFAGGSIKHVRLHVSAGAIAALTRHRHAVAVRITARTGPYRATKSLR